MSLAVWLPLNGDLHNQGLGKITSISGNPSYKTFGKLSTNALNLKTRITITCPQLANLQTFSIAFWAMVQNSDTLTSSWQDVMGFTDVSSGGINGTFRWETTYSSSNLGIHWHDNSTNALVNGSHNHNTVKEQWVHCCVVFDNITQKIYSYDNGILTQNHTHANGRFNSTGTFYLGETNNIEGMIQDVRIYNHALSNKEVKEISQGLILHYQLNQPNQNLILQSYYNNAPWKSAIKSWQTYEGKFSMLVNPATIYNNTDKGTTSYFPEQEFKENTQYVISLDTRDDYRTDGKSTGFRLGFHYTDGTNSVTNLGSPQAWTHYTIISTAGKTVDFIRGSYGNSGYTYVANLKVEEGVNETAFINNESNTIYDSSGYNNNGQLNEIIINSNCPKYNINSVFNGTNSYIKVIENKWMPQHTRELTINLWAKATTWPTSGRIFSCTESGGFNTEAGNSGYWRFPIYVCTNEAQTSYAYKYDSQEIQLSVLPVNEWVMLTFVYDSTGTRTYINGQLHHTYTNTSYGIHFNTNARLFLGCEANAASPSSPYFNGEESDFRIYVTALSADDILELYRTSKIVSGTTVSPRSLE